MSEVYWDTLQMDGLLENRQIVSLEDMSVKKGKNADSKKQTLCVQRLHM